MALKSTLRVINEADFPGAPGRSYIDLEELGKREGISFKSHY